MKALLYLVNNKEKILFLFYLIFIYYFIGACLFCNEKKERVSIWMSREVGKVQKEMGRRKTYSEYLVWKKNQFLIKKI